jgi:hypothetical protein
MRAAARRASIGSRRFRCGASSRIAFRLYQVHGNVGEWVQDCWNDSYLGAPSNGSAWMSGDCSRAVRRGALGTTSHGTSVPPFGSGTLATGGTTTSASALPGRMWSDNSTCLAPRSLQPVHALHGPATLPATAPQRLREPAAGAKASRRSRVDFFAFLYENRRGVDVRPNLPRPRAPPSSP